MFIEEVESFSFRAFHSLGFVGCVPIVSFNMDLCCPISLIYIFYKSIKFRFDFPHSFKWRWNSHNIKLPILKCTIQWHLIHWQCCSTITSVQFETFSSPQWESLYPVSSHFPSPTPPAPSPWQWLICFLSPWLCLFWIFNINGIIQYVTFCVWLLSLTIRLIYTVTCIIPFHG